MGCGCGGGFAASNSASYPAVAAAAMGAPQVYEVTFRDGRIVEYTSEAEAYSAIASNGGGGVRTLSKA